MFSRVLAAVSAMRMGVGTARRCRAGLVCVLLGGGTGGVLADTWYVDADASGANNGTSWAHAFTDLQSALAAAGAGDQVWVANGDYRPAAAGGSRDATFNIALGVAVYGGFAGGETALTQRNVGANPTVLSGDLNGDDGGRGIDDNVYNVVTFDTVDASTVLDGFTVTGGNATGPDSPPNKARGGGAWVFQSNCTIANCTFTGNRAGRGGGLYNRDSSSPTVTDCLFTDNVALVSGGGAFNANQSNPLMMRCAFSDNEAPEGGGLSNVLGQQAVLVECVFSGNSAGVNGGGIYFTGSEPLLDRCVITGNNAANGAGVYVTDYIAPSLYNCEISGNSASQVGGGAAVQGGWLVLAGCILRGNGAIMGGGVSSFSGLVTMTNCTMSLNTAAGGGGALRVESDFSIPDAVLLANCILAADNSAPLVASSTGLLEISYSMVAGGFPGAGNIAADPMFEAGSLRPGAGSPCIDAGSNDALGALLIPLATDRDGQPRQVDDPAAPDVGLGTPPLVDMGAYERQAGEPECRADWDDSGVVGSADITAFLGDWFADLANGTTVADFNNSGATGSADITAFLGAWFEAIAGGC